MRALYSPNLLEEVFPDVPIDTLEILLCPSAQTASSDLRESISKPRSPPHPDLMVRLVRAHLRLPGPIPHLWGSFCASYAFCAYAPNVREGVLLVRINELEHFLHPLPKVSRL
jgi:hypothetical protein